MRMSNEVDFDQEQTVEYNPETYVRDDDATEAAKMLQSYLERKGWEKMGRMVGNIRSIIASSAQDADAGENMYGSRVTYVDEDENRHTAIVLEPNVTEMPYEKAYDPNKEEYVDPEDYPWGTVQLIYPSNGKFSVHDTDDDNGFFFDRMGVLESATSVPPAYGPDDTMCYFPGWELALREYNQE